MYSERLKYLREKNNYNQTQLAEILNIDRSQYGHYENEYATIPIKHLITLCDFYNVSLDYIFGFTNLEKYNSSNTLNNKFCGLRLKEFRKENKIIQKKLADMLNVAVGTISGYESGRYLIATPFLYTICKKYNISADYLLGKIDNPKYL